MLESRKGFSFACRSAPRVFRSGGKTLVQRIQIDRKDENTIAYEVTMEDPEVLTKPWTLQSTMMLRPGTRLREYECVENNTDMERYEKLLKDESVFRRK